MKFTGISSPAELRGKSLSELQALAEDLRQQIISVCLKNGGHLGASLGAVEIAIALHYVFESPAEPILWDVGHQAYAHKLLTGRADRFESLRTAYGVSGFLVRAESPHDVFGAGHSSTALSAALGVAWAKGREASPGWTAAVVGDGGLTAGLALEALNNMGTEGIGPMLIVLNDNQMSISANVGGISRLLAEGRSREFFEFFGLDYHGPVDGHDLEALVNAFREAKSNYQGRPIVLHALTQKGRGYAPAESAPASYHGVGPISSTPKSSYSEAFGRALCRLAERDPRVVAVTAAMPEGTGLTEFARKFPDRFFDVGIAEPHAVTFAAGLATQGFRPVVAIYSTFLQRAYDSLIHDVALQNLHVVFAIDRAGIVGADGPTHHGAFDLAMIGAVPNFRIVAPACYADLDALLEEAINANGPCAIRYPRGGGATELAGPRALRWIENPAAPRAAVVALGATADRAARAAKTMPDIALAATVLAKPIAPELVTWLKARPELPLLIVEDGAIRGGFGQALACALGPRSGAIDFAGYEDHFIMHGSPIDLEQAERLSVEALVERLRAL
jgi:1-deoxy-D-xylulose-5-phosphate synthase